MSLYLVLVVKTSMDLSIMGRVETVPLSSAGLYGVCPVFEKLADAQEYADGKAQVIAVSEATP